MRPLLNGRNLDGWESRGDGQWTVMRDGTLVGQRVPDVRKMLGPNSPLKTEKDYNAWLHTQAWLYTKEEFREFDLHLEFWTRTGGNSGISIRDPGRAQYAVTPPPDFTKTPSKVAYEIQINNRYPDPHPTGSIYGFVDAPKEALINDDWNAMDVRVRDDKITVQVNGRVVAESAGDPKRPKTGPIGLQLHDQFSVILFRNIQIRVVSQP